MTIIRGLITRLLCSHASWVLTDQFFGDHINHMNGRRSEWRCEQCGKRALSYRLNELRRKP